MIIDTHSHLYAEEFDLDRAEVLTRATQTGVSAILLPNIDVESIAALENLADTTANCIPMMGLHQRILKYQHFYFGIGGVLTYNNAGLAEVVKEIPLDRLLLETDAPYLSPVPYRGKRNEPSYLIEVVTKLQEVLGLSAAQIEKLSSDNAIRLFALEKFLTFEHA